LKIEIDKHNLIFIPESSGDCFTLGQLSKNVSSCTQVYIDDNSGGVAAFQKLLIPKNIIIDSLCGE